MKAIYTAHDTLTVTGDNGQVHENVTPDNPLWDMFWKAVENGYAEAPAKPDDEPRE